MKIAGVALWIWVLGLVVLSSAAWIGLPMVKPMVTEVMKPVPLEVVKDAVWSSKSGSCEVRGQIHNPRDEGARDVIIIYKLWANRIGKNDEVQRDRKGTAVERIRFIPPGATVEFTAQADTRFGEHEFPSIDAAEIKEAADKN